jgi:cell division septation protein DedD
MGQEETTQLDLFSKDNSNQALKASSSGSLFTTLWNYEKLIFLIIGFIVTGVVCYCLGVERGKNISRLNIVTPAELTSPAGDQPEIQQNQAPLTVEGQADTSIASKKILPPATLEKTKYSSTPPKNTGTKFTVQIASYKQKSSAQKEAGQLKKKGLPTTVIPLNGYSVICIGSFSDKEKARSLLTEMKKQYRDCFIRRL